MAAVGGFVGKHVGGLVGEAIGESLVAAATPLGKALVEFAMPGVAGFAALKCATSALSRVPELVDSAMKSDCYIVGNLHCFLQKVGELLEYYSEHPIEKWTAEVIATVRCYLHFVRSCLNTSLLKHYRYDLIHPIQEELVATHEILDILKDYVDQLQQLASGATTTTVFPYSAQQFATLQTQIENLDKLVKGSGFVIFSSAL